MEKVVTHCLPPMSKGMLIALGFFSTTIFAVAISGTIKTWTTDEVLNSADLNTTIASLKTEIETIPNWTKATNGTDAYYTDGNVGIWTTSPGSLLALKGSSMVEFRSIQDKPLGSIYQIGNGIKKVNISHRIKKNRVDLFSRKKTSHRFYF